MLSRSHVVYVYYYVAERVIGGKIIVVKNSHFQNSAMPL
jgi:hypothetical protein